MRILVAFFCHRQARRILAILIALAMPLLSAAEIGLHPQSMSLTEDRAVKGPANRSLAAPAPRTCLPEAVTLTIVAQNATLCCCTDPSTRRQCCNYVRGTTCPKYVPGCGC
jgi:hypothetical protein